MLFFILDVSINLSRKRTINMTLCHIPKIENGDRRIQLLQHHNVVTLNILFHPQIINVGHALATYPKNLFPILYLVVRAIAEA